MSSAIRFSPCPNCCKECLACKDRQYPPELTVTFAGLQGDWSCRDCTNANNSWTLHQETECAAVERYGVIQSVVSYHGSFSEVPMCNCGGPTNATLEITLRIYWNYGGVAGRRYISVAIGNSQGCLSVSFERLENNQAEPFDCRHFSGLALGYDGSGAYCSSPGATCTVSA